MYDYADIQFGIERQRGLFSQYYKLLKSWSLDSEEGRDPGGGRSNWCGSQNNFILLS
jgi:hypothetical protein